MTDQVPGFPALTTDHLLLREFRPTDAESVFDSFSRANVTTYYNREPMQSLEEAEQMVNTRASLFEKGWGVRWAITFVGKSDTVIGSCGYYNLNRAFRIAEIGYDLHPDHWRCGIMTEALTAALNFGFSESFFYHLNRIEAVTYVEHQASIGLLRKLGFVEEGIRREYGFWKNQYHDLRSFALLRRDWETLQDRRS